MLSLSSPIALHIHLMHLILKIEEKKYLHLDLHWIKPPTIPDYPKKKTWQNNTKAICFNKNYLKDNKKIKNSWCERIKMASQSNMLWNVAPSTYNHLQKNLSKKLWTIKRYKQNSVNKMAAKCHVNKMEWKWRPFF